MWVSVNLSTPQFNQPSLADNIAGALRDAGLPARCLVVELTEGVAMENPAAVKGLLMQLRIMGVRVALDDFGTGQSSLAYLHQFPADKLKLDRSFVCDMETRADVRDIVAAVTGLAHRLGLEVIAEGVETDGQLALVRSLECEYVQGFVFSKPVDPERAAALLRTGFAPRPAAEQAPGQPTAPDAAPRQRGTTIETTRRRSRVSNALYVSAAVVITVALSGVVNRVANQPAAPATCHSASSPGDANRHVRRRTRACSGVCGDVRPPRDEAGRVLLCPRSQARAARVHGAVHGDVPRGGVRSRQPGGQGEGLVSSCRSASSALPSPATN